MLEELSFQYTYFSLAKRRGGFRPIAAPKKGLMHLQRTIYHRILLPVHVHPAATGFRNGLSIVHNARPHLGKKEVLKLDIRKFFPSIKRRKVVQVFQTIGYPKNVSEVLAELCCLNGSLPQGAPTSPALSNIIVREMDKRLQEIAGEHGLTYTRYADDLTFSGDSIHLDTLLPLVNEALKKDRLVLKKIKTRYLRENRRKIITGVSISSGHKLTIPKARKRELRKTIYFIRTKGLAEHQKHIGSTDPFYLKKVVGYLSYWRSIEPENPYVIESMKALKRIGFKI